MIRPPRPRNASLAAAMARQGWTGRSLAKASGLSETTVSKLLNRRETAGPETAAAIARVLQVSPDALDLTEGSTR